MRYWVKEKTVWLYDDGEKVVSGKPSRAFRYAEKSLETHEPTLEQVLGVHYRESQSGYKQFWIEFYRYSPIIPAVLLQKAGIADKDDRPRHPRYTNWVNTTYNTFTGNVLTDREIAALEKLRLTL